MVWRIEKGEKMEWNGMRRMVFPNTWLESNLSKVFLNLNFIN